MYVLFFISCPEIILLHLSNSTCLSKRSISWKINLKEAKIILCVSVLRFRIMIVITFWPQHLCQLNDKYYCRCDDRSGSNIFFFVYVEHKSRSHDYYYYYCLHMNFIGAFAATDNDVYSYISILLGLGLGMGTKANKEKREFIMKSTNQSTKCGNFIDRQKFSTEASIDVLSA